MKTMLINIARRVVHYLWINRKTVYSIAKKYYKTGNINGKIRFSEFLELVEIVKNSGLKIGKDTEIPVGADFTSEDELINSLPDNQYKTITEYKQKGPTCAIYSTGRAVHYNTGVFTTQEEVELVAQKARDEGKLDKNGMTFIDAGDVWTRWVFKNKGVEIKVFRVPMYSRQFNTLTEKGYSYVTGGAITDSFFFEREDDGVVDINKIRWNDKTEYLHAWTGETIINFTDNFAGAINYNRFVNENHPEFIRRGKFFAWAYFPLLIEDKKGYKTLMIENGILRRRADEVDELLHKALKANKPNDY